MAGGEWHVVPQNSRPRRHTRDPDDDGGDVVIYSPSNRSANQISHPPRRGIAPVTPFVLILVGIPGSGKSTFACRLEELAPWKYVRVSQDSIGNRRDCEVLTRRILSQNRIPIIDRCNFNLEQRKYWIDIANEARVPCDCIVFSYDPKVCIRRCQQRINHETVTSRNASIVVRNISNMLQAPVPLDGAARHNIRCWGGEVFRKIERVSSFPMADNLVGRYLQG
ncbi:hypothetical protein HJC23_000419 [Cyclotella cryptica]|uniref:Uncharacterized protein n=1 Tax=Cyclotella cryptica TaxID=29204 RepID=A0ABD3PJG3_9STRA|eukprot:CCRYP_014183-RB/>CCRYP_014183-RB protein AED:0.03 eAED:0.03 QI:302/1/1/1/1/1/2/602/222